MKAVEERGPTFPRGIGGVVERLHGLNKLRHCLCRDLRIFAKGFRPERVGFPADGRGIVGKTVHRIVFRPASRPNPRPDRARDACPLGPLRRKALPAAWQGMFTCPRRG